MLLAEKRRPNPIRQNKRLLRGEQSTQYTTRMTSDVERYAGIDIGGTKIGVCLGDAGGALLWKDSFPCAREASPRDLLADALARIEGASEGRAPLALGVSCPGPFSAKTRSFLDPPNMPAWHGFAIEDFLRSRVSLPIVAKNDANALALAEHMWGAGRGASNLVFFTMSTGFGAGLVLDGKLYEGRGGFAGEVGHLRLSEEGPVGFGKRGSVEGWLSGPGMAQQARAERLRCEQVGETTALSACEVLDARALCEAAAAGDAAALRVTQRIGARLGQLMSLLVDVLEPELFVLGTIGRAWPQLFLEPAQEVLRREALAISCEGLRIVPSELRDHGAQSALALARLAAR